MLGLARTYPFARKLVNSGRLSLPRIHTESPLNTPDVPEERWATAVVNGDQGTERVGLLVADAQHVEQAAMGQQHGRAHHHVRAAQAARTEPGRQSLRLHSSGNNSSAELITTE